MVEIGREFYATHPFWKFAEYDDADVYTTLAVLIESPDGVVFVGVEGEEIVGGIVGIVAPAFTNTGVRTANEVAWFVRPSHRTTRTGFALFRALERWAGDVGAHVLIFSAITGGTDVEKLYTRLGYEAYETSYMKEIK